MPNTICPLLIPSMGQALNEAAIVSKKYPHCFTPELTSIGAKIAIATVSNFTAEHLIRTAGGMASLTRFAGVPIPQALRAVWFWAGSQHDELKMANGFYQITEDEERVLSEDERHRLSEHVISMPFAKREQQRLFRYRDRNAWMQTIAAGALHHVLSSRYPVAERDLKRPWIPTIDELIYSQNQKRRSADIAFLKDVFNLLTTFRAMRNVDQFLNIAKEGLVGNTAVMVALLTAADVIDATHRRKYQGSRQWAEHQDFIRDLLVNYTDFPLAMVEVVIDWVFELQSAEHYNEITLQTGWDSHAPAVLLAHQAIHAPGEPCGLAQYINHYAQVIEPDSQIHRWMNKFITPHLVTA